MSQNNKNIPYILIFLFILLVFPYIIASNAGEAGIVISSQKINTTSLPTDIQDIQRLNPESYNYVLIEDQVNKVSKSTGLVGKERKLVISRQTHEIGSFVAVENVTADIYVTSYNIIDQDFNKLIIGETKKPYFGEVIEGLNYYGIIFILGISKIVYYTGGLMIVLILTLLYNRGPALWNIPAVAAFYSFQTFLMIIMEYLNYIEMDGIAMAFSFLFIVLVPLTIWLQRYEKTDGGKQKIYKLYSLNKKIFLKIKNKLWPQNSTIYL
jgi:hypothetical protein